MTVSNVVNGRLHSVGESTAQRVRDEIARLDYRPHKGATSLRQGKSYSVGLLIVSSEAAFLGSPFASYLVAGLSNFLSEHGYSLSIQGVRLGQADLSNIFPRVTIDGICAYLAGQDAQRAQMQCELDRFGVPLVFFQDRLLVPIADSCIVRQDDREGGRILGQLLVQRGARNLLLIRQKVDWPAFADRENGIRDALSSNAPDARLRVVWTADEDPAHIRELLEEEFRKAGKPDAVLASNDQLAIASLMFARNAGISVPRDLLITGFNGFDFWQYTEPLIASVKSRAQEIGSRGGLEMLERLKTGHFPDREVVFPVTYLPGGSV